MTGYLLKHFRWSVFADVSEVDVKTTGAVVFLLVLLSGCVAIPPELNLHLTDPPPGLGQVQAAPDQYRGQVVRWGGTIIGIENTRDSSVVEVVARPLQATTRPDERGISPGRFVIVTSNFLDPEVFKAGGVITVTGTLDGIRAKKVGEYDYRYPVLRAQGYHLWSPLAEHSRSSDPYWGYPWMYPWGPYDYWRHPHYRRW